MSSTNRGAKRQEYDYYATPVDEIERFLQAWCSDCPRANTIRRVLDPCASGNAKPILWEWKEGQFITVPPTLMAYPTALQRVFTGLEIITSDIRRDSLAMYYADALAMDKICLIQPDLVITNPPFSIAMEVIEAALRTVRDGGYVVMLLRLNFLEGAKRRDFLQHNAPQRIYVHPNRMSFLPNGKTDSIAYAHMVWQRGCATDHAITKVL